MRGLKWSEAQGCPQLTPVRRPLLPPAPIEPGVTLERQRRKERTMAALLADSQLEDMAEEARNWSASNGFMVGRRGDPASLNGASTYFVPAPLSLFPAKVRDPGLTRCANEAGPIRGCVRRGTQARRWTPCSARCGRANVPSTPSPHPHPPTHIPSPSSPRPHPLTPRLQ